MDLVNSLVDRLLFAVPKKGRLHEKVLELLRGSDIQFHRHNRLDIALSTNLPVALVFLPASDIPRFVGEGRVALGITGVDVIQESKADVKIDLPLEFGKCKLQVQVPARGPYTKPEQLVGRSIVTSFIHLTTLYFAKLEGLDVETIAKENGLCTTSNEIDYILQKHLKTKIKYVGGSVEAACALGLADAIVDLVESGETMRAAGLAPIANILDTEAVLISSKKREAFSFSTSAIASATGKDSPSNVSDHHELADILISRINGVVTAQKYVLCNYNAPKSKLKTLLKITPGRRAATVSPLEDEEWVAVSSMILKKELAPKMDDLARNGAEDVLVFQIINSRV